MSSDWPTHGRPGPEHALHPLAAGSGVRCWLAPAAAVPVAIVLYAVLPESLLLGPRFLIPGLECAFLVALIATNPWRMTRHTRWSRLVSLLLAALVVTTNLVSLALLVNVLVSSADTKGSSLLLAALQVWATNVIA